MHLSDLSPEMQKKFKAIIAEEIELLKRRGICTKAYKELADRKDTFSKLKGG